MRLTALLTLLTIMVAGCAADPPLLDGRADNMQAPNISFYKQSESAALRIVNADADADWADIDIHLEGCTASMDGRALPADGPVSVSSDRIEAGDSVQFEGSGDCTVMLTHAPTNALYDSWTFSL